MDQEIQSHIQMPRFMLKRFENEYHKLFYYDVEKRHIGNNGTSKSIGTQQGYFSPNMENYLSKNSERPFSEALQEIDRLNLDPPNFEISLEARENTLNFIYALMARSKRAENQALSRFPLLCGFPERDLHKIVVKNGIEAGIDHAFFDDHHFGLICNKTSIPFILPTNGVYGAIEEGREIYKHIILPISPSLAIALRAPGKDECQYSFLCHEWSEERINALNCAAFDYQCKFNTGYIVSQTREPLQNAMDNHTKNALPDSENTK